MTKKDYELIAASVSRTIWVMTWNEKNKTRRQGAIKALNLVANDLAGSLYGDNIKFDRNKFLQACGVEITT